MPRRRPNRYALPTTIRSGDMITVEWFVTNGNGDDVRYTATARVTGVQLSARDSNMKAILAGTIRLLTFFVYPDGTHRVIQPNIDARIFLIESSPVKDSELPGMGWPDDLTGGSGKHRDGT